MPVVHYTAKRSLVSGVSVNDLVTLGLPLRYGGMTRARASSVFKRRSLSRVQEAYYYTAGETWACETYPLLVTGDAAKALRQFLDSVEDGQLFEFAPDESVGDSPINFQNAVLETVSYTEAREASLQTYVTYSFTISSHP